MSPTWSDLYGIDPDYDGGKLALRTAVEKADHCHGIVTRQGDEDACGKPPVAMIDGRVGDEGYWPACAYHANRWGQVGYNRLVTLAEIVEALS